jgi:hypothetical protein
VGFKDGRLSELAQDFFPLAGFVEMLHLRVMLLEIYLFIVYLTTVSVPRAIQHWMVEWLVNSRLDMNMKGSNCGLIWGTILEFSRRNWENPWKAYHYSLSPYQGFKSDLLECEVGVVAPPLTRSLSYSWPNHNYIHVCSCLWIEGTWCWWTSTPRAISLLSKRFFVPFTSSEYSYFASY